MPEVYVMWCMLCSAHPWALSMNGIMQYVAGAVLSRAACSQAFAQAFAR